MQPNPLASSHAALAPHPIDVRTRTDGPLEPVDADDFFGRALPAAFDAAAERLAPALAWLAPRPLVVRVGERAWTLRCEDARARSDAGDAGAPSLTLEPEALAELVADLVTPMGWLISGRLRATAKLPDLLDWWIVLRAVLDGITPYTPGSVDFVTPGGAPLDLRRSFRPDDPPEEMRWFLSQAGFLHIAGVFTEDEMAAVSAEMDRLAPAYRRGDGASWWARTADGGDRLVRMQGFAQRSETTAALLGEPRFAGIGALAGCGHQLGWSGRLHVEALVKPLRVVEGISDVPWHKDCANGRHSYECCNLTAGVSVTGADAVSGQLRVVAGSHRAFTWPSFVRDGLDLPQLDLPTRTGDVTIHASCTIHMAQPPVERERRVLYTAFTLPPRDAEATQRARLRARKVRDAAHVTVSQRSTVEGDA